jgi:hypothetical protein
MGKKRLLQTPVQWRALRQSLNGCDFAFRRLSSGHETRANWLTVEQDRAGSTVARIAADFRSRQTKIVAQHA